MAVSLEMILDGSRDPQFAPENYLDLELEANFDKPESQAALTSSSLRLYGNFKKRVDEWQLGGADGSSPGVFETIPLEIVINEDGADEIRLVYGIDLSNANTFYGQDYTEVFIERYESIDWLNSATDSFSWSLLLNEGIITEADYNKSPYVVDFEEELTKTFLFFLTLFILGTQLRTVIKDLLNNIAEFVPGFFTILKAIVAIFINLVAIVFIIIAIINLLINFFETIISPVKFHNGMYWKKMWEKGCEYLGLEFKSTIFDNDLPKLFHLPTKDRVGFSVLNDPDNIGIPRSGSPIENFKAFVDVNIRAFNGEMRIRNGVLRFEKRRFFKALTNYVLPDVDLVGYTLNTNEFKANRTIEFARDQADLNTFEDGAGYFFQVQVKPQVVNDKKRQKLTGIDQINIPFSLVKRKDELTGLEKLYKKITDPLAVVANAVLKAINEIKKVGQAIADFIRKIKKVLKFVGIKIKDEPKKDPPKEKKINFGKVETNRIGSIQMSNDFVTVPRLMILDNERIPANHKEILSAEVIYNKFHAEETLDPTKNNGKQARVYKNVNVDFSAKDFVTLLDNNFFKTREGKEGEMDSVRWRPLQCQATVDFKIEQIWTRNVKDVPLPRQFSPEEEDDPNQVDRNYSPAYSGGYG